MQTIELTFWLKNHRAWLSVHANRTAPWIDVIRAKLESRLRNALDAAGD